jgi:hypothetical protein
MHTENPATTVAGSALTPTVASSHAATQPGASADPSVNLNQDREAPSTFHANPPNCPSAPSVSRMAQPSVPSHSICIPYRLRFANSSAEGITSFDNSGRIRPLLFPGHSPPPLLALLELLFDSLFPAPGSSDRVHPLRLFLPITSTLGAFFFVFAFLASSPSPKPIQLFGCYLIISCLSLLSRIAEHYLNLNLRLSYLSMPMFVLRALNPKHCVTYHRSSTGRALALIHHVLPHDSNRLKFQMAEPNPSSRAPSGPLPPDLFGNTLILPPIENLKIPFPARPSAGSASAPTASSSYAEAPGDKRADQFNRRQTVYFRLKASNSSGTYKFANSHSLCVAFLPRLGAITALATAGLFFAGKICLTIAIDIVQLIHRNAEHYLNLNLRLSYLSMPMLVLRALNPKHCVTYHRSSTGRALALFQHLVRRSRQAVWRPHAPHASPHVSTQLEVIFRSRLASILAAEPCIFFDATRRSRSSRFRVEVAGDSSADRAD